MLSRLVPFARPSSLTANRSIMSSALIDKFQSNLERASATPTIADVRLNGRGKTAFLCLPAIK